MGVWVSVRARTVRANREFWRSIMSIVCTKWFPGELLSAKDTHLRAMMEWDIDSEDVDAQAGASWTRSRLRSRASTIG